MKHEKGTLLGKRSLRLAYAAWLPDDKPKAFTVLVHGYGEHMGRYAHVVEALVQRNYAVWTIDHRGHGMSAGLRAHVERFDYFVDDLHLLVRKAKAVHPALPLFMIGHSMGALIATRYALLHQAELDGLVLSGAALQVGDGISPLLKKMSRLLALLIPTMPITRAAGRPGESVLSRDPTVQERFNADALVYNGKLRARMGYEILRAANDTRTHMSRLSLPLLIMHGAEDRFTNPNGSIHLYEQASSADKTLKLWDGCRHEIFNEPEKDDVIAFTLDWLDAYVRRRVMHAA